MIKLFLLLSFCCASNSLDRWIVKNKEIFKNDIKSISFDISTDSKKVDILYDSTVSIKLFIQHNNFRFEMGSRVVLSDGEIWKIYDSRTNQIFIQSPNKKIEKIFSLWFDFKKIKAMPLKLQNDGSYSLLLFNDYEIAIYFSHDSDNLESIYFIHDDVEYIINNLNFIKEEYLDFTLGNQKSEIFDLR